MFEAIDLAKQGAGYVSPNPMVGCIILDKSGNQIGEVDIIKRLGKHAEVNAVGSVKNIKDLRKPPYTLLLSHVLITEKHHLVQTYLLIYQSRE